MFKVGDVVIDCIDMDKIKAVIIDEETEFASTVYILTENGRVEERGKECLKKTGKHIDIESLLRQIGE